ncbi:MAG: ArgR family transcriptional regulator [Marinilabiliales bacterium]|nr:MAG: ArgR family transcriptional regulator [Marinilabiliales bacterium]
MNRIDRLLKIRKLIKNNSIRSQDELLNMLTYSGYSYTQATLSRDLKLLRAGKRPDNEKGLVYFLPDDEPSDSDNELLMKDAMNQGYLSIDYTGNMAVIKTLPGFASGIAYRIDGLKAFEILGTIAGDDTILVIAREGISRRDLDQVLKAAIPEERQV